MVEDNDSLYIEFKFNDYKIREVRMDCASFHNKEICAGGGKSHFENMIDNSMTCADGTDGSIIRYKYYKGDIVRFMYINCIKQHYINEKEFDKLKWLDLNINKYECNHVIINEAALPVKVYFM